jgi:hypothetical protein
MLVYLVDVQCPADAHGAKKFLQFAILSESETLATATICTTLRLHAGMVTGCRPARDQREHRALKPHAPKLVRLVSDAPAGSPDRG